MSESIQVLSARPVLGCADLAVASGFWCDVLGFQLAVQRDGFLLLRSGKTEVALRPDDQPVSAQVTLEVASVDTAWDRCAAAGARVVQPMFTHTSGRRHFRIADPDGHVLEIAEPPSRAGQLAWVDLTVEDATAARDFWFHVAGFDAVEAVSMGAYNDFTLTTDGEAIAGVCHRRGPNRKLPPVWLVYFTVADLDTAVAEAERRGGEVVDRRDRMAVVKGPQGATAALYQS